MIACDMYVLVLCLTLSEMVPGLLMDVVWVSTAVATGALITARPFRHCCLFRFFVSFLSFFSFFFRPLGDAKRHNQINAAQCGIVKYSDHAGNPSQSYLLACHLVAQSVQFAPMLWRFCSAV